MSLGSAANIEHLSRPPGNGLIGAESRMFAVWVASHTVAIPSEIETVIAWEVFWNQ